MPVLDPQTIIAIASRAINTEAIARHVRSGECILFLGSGVNSPSPEFGYTDDASPPGGAALSEMLARECGFSEYCPNDSPTDLQRVSLCYELAKSRSELVERIREAVHVGKRPSPALRALARLPFTLIITTNYDQLFEGALREVGKQPQIGVYNPDEFTPQFLVRNVTPQEPFVLKIHGDIQRPESIVVTDEDYIQFVLRMSNKDQFHPVPMAFRYHFTQWPTIFVGYSMLDYNLRLLFKTLSWKLDRAQIQPFYSVDPSPDPLIFDVWYNQKKYVTFIAQDVWKFVPDLYRRVTGEEELPR